jgi:hypothetical protein
MAKQLAETLVILKKHLQGRESRRRDLIARVREVARIVCPSNDDYPWSTSPIAAVGILAKMLPYRVVLPREFAPPVDVAIVQTPDGKILIGGQVARMYDLVDPSSITEIEQFFRAVYGAGFHK